MYRHLGCERGAVGHQFTPWRDNPGLPLFVDAPRPGPFYLPQNHPPIAVPEKVNPMHTDPLVSEILRLQKLLLQRRDDEQVDSQLEQQEALSRKVKALEEVLSTKVVKLREAHSGMAELKYRHSVQMSELKYEHSIQMSELKRAHSAKLIELETAHASEMAEREYSPPAPLQLIQDELERAQSARMAVLELQFGRSHEQDQCRYVSIKELFCDPSEVHRRAQQGTVVLFVELRESWFECAWQRVRVKQLELENFEIQMKEGRLQQVTAKRSELQAELHRAIELHRVLKLEHETILKSEKSFDLGKST
eukprot:jgi/Botrbrau1/22291/Bobra.0138s0043.1